MPEKLGKRFIRLFILIVLSGAGYLAANLWGRFWGATDLHTAFDDYVPFVPKAIFAYLLFFLFFLTPIFSVKKYSDFMMFIFVYAVLIFVSLVIFFQFSTTMLRPEAPNSGLIGWLFGIIRAVDGPHNLFPSLHVSSVVLVAFVNGYFCPKTKWLSWICALLISFSTLLVKQHSVIDVLGGALLGTAAYLLLRLLKKQ